MNVCSECALRLFNTKNYNLQGIGNPYFGKCIVVPNVDYIAYKKGDMGFSTQVEIIQDVLSSTGEGDNVFIVPLIRCNESISCDLTDDIYNRCITYFARDIKKYNFTDIMLLGEAGRKFLNCNIEKYNNSLFVSPNRRRYVVNYSPLIKYVDAIKYETFKSNLQTWISCTNSKQFIPFYKEIISL